MEAGGTTAPPGTAHPCCSPPIFLWGCHHFHILLTLEFTRCVGCQGPRAITPQAPPWESILPTHPPGPSGKVERGGGGHALQGLWAPSGKKLKATPAKEDRGELQSQACLKRAGQNHTHRSPLRFLCPCSLIRPHSERQQGRPGRSEQLYDVCLVYWL